MAADGHHGLQINFDGNVFVAACGCGWISTSRYSSSGLAGSAWDTHVAEVRAASLDAEQVADAGELTG